MLNDPYLRTAEVAEYLNLDLPTIQGLLKSGIIKGEKLSSGKNSSWRISLSELKRVEKFLRR